MLIAGEPGIGKTRLAAELGRAVDLDGGFVLLGRCDDGLGVPYQPFVEALAHVVGHAPDAEVATLLGPGAGELSRLVPELAQRLPGLRPPRAIPRRSDTCSSKRSRGGSKRNRSSPPRCSCSTICIGRPSRPCSCFVTS